VDPRLRAGTRALPGWRAGPRGTRWLDARSSRLLRRFVQERVGGSRTPPQEPTPRAWRSRRRPRQLRPCRPSPIDGGPASRLQVRMLPARRWGCLGRSTGFLHEWMAAEIDFRASGGHLSSEFELTHYAPFCYPAEVLGDDELWRKLRGHCPAPRHRILRRYPDPAVPREARRRSGAAWSFPSVRGHGPCLDLRAWPRNLESVHL
jgi:hypothetical protein